ncbi:MAG: hypothetical protein U5R31_05595 [Acidimicrobiia bacterium]|nr:hypothetical protein [Acidimicrobiia bacterium]
MQLGLGHVRRRDHRDRGQPAPTHFVRTLFALPSDERVCAFLVLGDKNTDHGPSGNDWYDEAIPLADAMWAQILADGTDR